jgi:hypothetical protein
MSKHIETLKKAHEAFNAHHVDEAVKVLAPQGTMTDHGRAQVHRSRDAFKTMLSGFIQMSSDIRIVDAVYTDAGEKVIAQFRAIGTQDGPLPNSPLGISNKPFSLDVCEVWHFNNRGEAIEGHNYSDSYGLLVQLGHIKEA